MTERKPAGMSHESWIDRQVREAAQRGLFDNLPGAGKPLSIKPGAGDGDYAMREAVSDLNRPAPPPAAEPPKRRWWRRRR